MHFFQNICYLCSVDIFGVSPTILSRPVFLSLLAVIFPEMDTAHPDTKYRKLLPLFRIPRTLSYTVNMYIKYQINVSISRIIINGNFCSARALLTKYIIKKLIVKTVNSLGIIYYVL